MYLENNSYSKIYAHYGGILYGDTSNLSIYIYKEKFLSLGTPELSQGDLLF